MGTPAAATRATAVAVAEAARAIAVLSAPVSVAGWGHSCVAATAAHSRPVSVRACGAVEALRTTPSTSARSARSLQGDRREAASRGLRARLHCLSRAKRETRPCGAHRLPRYAHPPAATVGCHPKESTCRQPRTPVTRPPRETGDAPVAGSARRCCSVVRVARSSPASARHASVSVRAAAKSALAAFSAWWSDSGAAARSLALAAADSAALAAGWCCLLSARSDDRDPTLASRALASCTQTQHDQLTVRPPHPHVRMPPPSAFHAPSGGRVRSRRVYDACSRYVRVSCCPSRRSQLVWCGARRRA